jgi:SAM-dependent methyltransferase
MNEGEGTARTVGEDAAAGAAIYTPFVLRLYDLGVHGLSNRFVWKCPTAALLALYDRNVTARHLDVGVGTGLFLDRCRFPTDPQITLLDLNPNALRFAAQRIKRYHRVSTQQANVMEPLSVSGAPFDSIGLCYLLHCLPGPLPAKAIVLRHLGAQLAPGGVLFGATLLGKGVPHTSLARRLMRLYNRRGIFCNEDDSLEDLNDALDRCFTTRSVVVHGCAALFEARGYRRS